jgi:chromosomal replication initiation ATPase DnaA
LRHLIEAAIGDVFGVPRAHLSAPSRGKAPVALARQAAMYLAHVSCGLSLTDVGLIFARDRTTVAHACAVIEDRRDDPVFDHALELMEWMVPTLVGRDLMHAHRDI